jgi:3D (Asp-Asp-Asp) domain-containing protein
MTFMRSGNATRDVAKTTTSARTLSRDGSLAAGETREAIRTLGILVALLLQVGPIFQPMPPADPPERMRTCFQAMITGYNRLSPYMNPTTIDGTSITTPEPIVAASPDVPLQSTVEIDGLGTFRVADRGSGVRWRHIDVAVWSSAEAYQLTGTRQICWRDPDGE